MEWRIGTKTGRNANIIYRVSDDEFEDGVCMVYGIYSNQSVEECQDCEGMPNAKLICAAPLIPECEEVIAELSGIIDVMLDEIDDKTKNQLRHWIDSLTTQPARTLLSKLKAARGGE